MPTLPGSGPESRWPLPPRGSEQFRRVAEGFGVRVYVPFGTEWYPYFMRRLAERPANVLFLAKNFFKS